MTALFFIPQGRTVQGPIPQGPIRPGPGRRVDLAALARLFGEADEPPPRRPARRPVARLALLALVLLGAFGDVVLVGRPGALAPGVGVGRPGRALAPSGPQQA